MSSIQPAPFVDQLESRFQARMYEISKQSFRLACILAISLFPAFSVVDYFTHRDHVTDLNVIRYFTVAIIAGIFLRIRSKNYKGNIYLAGTALLTVAELGIVFMTLRLGGYESPYYAGVNLVILGASVLFPWGWKRMGILLSWMFLLYLAPVLFAAHFEITNWPIFVNNIAFVASTCVIGTASAHLSDRLRRHDFSSFRLITSA